MIFITSWGDVSFGSTLRLTGLGITIIGLCALPWAGGGASCPRSAEGERKAATAAKCTNVLNMPGLLIGKSLGQIHTGFDFTHCSHWHTLLHSGFAGLRYAFFTGLSYRR